MRHGTGILLQFLSSTGSTLQVSTLNKSSINCCTSDSATMATREENVYLAKLAEQTERYEDMVAHMNEIVASKENLSVEERNLLSVAYKNIIGARRASWRIISSLESKVANSSSDDKSSKGDMIASYKKKIEAELEEKCDDVLKLLGDVLTSSGDLDAESSVFYLKMEGDYQRYIAEFATEHKKEAAKMASLKAYDKATAIACDNLPAIHPVRLGLALNFSVFHYEIMNSPAAACDLAKKAFDEALEAMDKVQDDVYKDSTLIMQLLRDNLTLWTSEGDEFDNDEIKQENCDVKQEN